MAENTKKDESINSIIGNNSGFEQKVEPTVAVNEKDVSSVSKDEFNNIEGDSLKSSVNLNEFDNIESEISNKKIEESVNDNLEATSQAVEDLNLRFSAQLYMGSVMFRQNLDDLNLTQVKFMNNEEKEGMSFSDHMFQIKDDIEEILLRDDLTASDKKYAVETLSLIEVSLENLTNDTTKNLNVVERMQHYTESIQKRLNKEDDNETLIQKVEDEKERRKKIKEMEDMLSSDNQDILMNNILENSNWRLDKSQEYFKIADTMRKQDFEFSLEVFKARKDSNPGNLIHMLKINPHILGSNMNVEQLVRMQVMANKKELQNSSISKRLSHSFKREMQASNTMFRDIVMTNPLALPAKGLLLLSDFKDNETFGTTKELQIKRYEAMANVLHEAGIKAGQAAVLKQANQLKKDAVTEEDVKNIQKTVKDSFNGLQNQSIIGIKSIIDDAKNGKISPILSEPLRKVQSIYRTPEKDVEIDLGKQTSRRKLRMS